MKSITATDLVHFRENYHHSSLNKHIERQITKHGLEEPLIDHRILRENPARFNLVLPSYHHYDQHNSGRCWCFSGINTIEGDIAHNLNIIPRRFALSANFLTFYDKLEKTNFLYNYVLERDVTFNQLRQTVFREQDPLCEGSYFDTFANLVYKYGLVPLSVMPENQNTNNSRDHFLHLWREKARSDALELFESKFHLSTTKLYELKKQKLSEIYALLSKISGEPPAQFNYKYLDRSGHLVHLRNYTPAHFRDEFLTLNLRKFRLICCNPLRKYYTSQTIEKGYSDNPFHPEIKYLNLPKSDMKKLAVMQLQAGLPVKMGARIRLFKHQDVPILDTRLYNYRPLGLEPVDYETGIKTRLVEAQHGMVILGAQIENGHPVRWKVENSHAEAQFYTMNDNFFDACVVNISIYEDILRQSGIKQT